MECTAVERGEKWSGWNGDSARFGQMEKENPLGVEGMQCYREETVEMLNEEARCWQELKYPI